MTCSLNPREDAADHPRPGTILLRSQGPRGRVWTGRGQGFPAPCHSGAQLGRRESVEDSRAAAKITQRAVHSHA